MKVLLYITALLFAVINCSSAFVAPAQNRVTIASSSTAVSMGLFDMFMSEEERQKKKERAQRERDEQEKVQREILELRRNPEAMDEYMARAAVRRKLYMNGMEDEAKKMKVMTDKPTQDE